MITTVMAITIMMARIVMNMIFVIAMRGILISMINYDNKNNESNDNHNDIE